MRIQIQIDRALPVPVTTQVQGQIEYGVSNGDFPPGSRLPSVRELALELGVSPVTISQVYRSLQQKGLLESLHGRGTYVSHGAPALGDSGLWTRVDKLISQLLRTAENDGIPRSSLLERLQGAVAHGRYSAPLRIVLVGVFDEVTRVYAEDLRRHLRADDQLDVTTFAQIESNGKGLALLAQTDLALTFAHRQADLQELCPPGCRLASIALIPSERTRIALAEVDPLARVVLVSDLPEFLPTLRRSTERYGPHIESITPAVGGSPETRMAVAAADVVIYATGSEAVLDGLSGQVRSFEFRHAPDPIQVERVLLPFIAQVRADKSRSTVGTKEEG